VRQLWLRELWKTASVRVTVDLRDGLFSAAGPGE